MDQDEKRPFENDPKEEAKKEVKRYSVQQDLRQFLKLESGLGNSKAFVSGHERIFGTPDVKLDPPLKCSKCAYVAETRKDADWHSDRVPGHLFSLPVKGR